jgi:hypothetical protein
VCVRSGVYISLRWSSHCRRRHDKVLKLSNIYLTSVCETIYWLSLYSFNFYNCWTSNLIYLLSAIGLTWVSTSEIFDAIMKKYLLQLGNGIWSLDGKYENKVIVRCCTDCVIDIVNVGVFGDFVIECLSELEQVVKALSAIKIMFGYGIMQWKNLLVNIFYYKNSKKDLQNSDKYQTSSDRIAICTVDYSCKCYKIVSKTSYSFGFSPAVSV